MNIRKPDEILRCLLDAGFAEIEIGIIPGGVDRILVGDVERTRLKQVKILFFLGVNDGNIPGNNTKGGIISDIDREFLQESGVELAPTPRQQMYIQRLYLYMNLTKPSDSLYLSYARASSEGKSIRPSYLIDMVRRLYPGITVERPDMEKHPVTQIAGYLDGLTYLAGALRDYAAGKQDSLKAQEVSALLSLYDRNEEYGALAGKMEEAAFMQYRHSPLSHIVAKAIYGSMLENSVSRLEQYASCAYAHFLQYGLKLQEREEYSFEQVDLGNLYHTVLELYADRLGDNGFPEQDDLLLPSGAVDGDEANIPLRDPGGNAAHVADNALDLVVLALEEVEAILHTDTAYGLELLTEEGLVLGFRHIIGKHHEHGGRRGGRNPVYW